MQVQPPDLLDKAHQLGAKLVEKYKHKIQLVSTSVSSIDSCSLVESSASTVVAEEVSDEFDDSILSSIELTTIMENKTKEIIGCFQTSHLGVKL